MSTHRQKGGHLASPGPALEAASDAPMTEQAYVALEEQIVTLKIAPGARVSEHELAEQLGLGRTPTREALQRLAREGLVEIQPRRGILVTCSDPAKQLLVLEVRREIERLLSRAAAERATADQREALRAIADGMDTAAKADDDIAFMRHDRAFNLLLLEAAHNEFAAAAMRLINGQSRRFWYEHYKAAIDLPLCARMHAEQARAIANGDASEAGEALDRLMDYTEAFTAAVVDAPR